MMSCVRDCDIVGFGVPQRTGALPGLFQSQLLRMDS